MGNHFQQTSQLLAAYLHHAQKQRRAAVVVPDNVLFEGGAGETVRKKLLQMTDLHTILRLSDGDFLRPRRESKCVVPFDNRPAQEKAVTQEVWVYDYRTNVHHTLKKKPMQLADLQDFITCYCPEDRSKRAETYHAENNPDGRWRKFSIDEINQREKTSLDIFWLKDHSLTDLDNLPAPDILADENH